MANTPAITLIRRCLMLSIITLASACSSMKQTPHVNATDSITAVASQNSRKPAPISEKSFLVPKKATPVVTTEEVSSIEDLFETSEIVIEELKDIPDNKVIPYLVDTFKISNDYAKRIFDLATLHSDSDFPKRNDILAIIAVESRFKEKAVYKGSYGLMQVEKKSHLKKLKGRNVLNPEVNIEIGADILKEYYRLNSNNRMAAILSYNAGIGNYKKKRYRLKYYSDVTKHLRLLPRG